MLTPQSWRHTGADAPASQAGSGGKLRIRPLVYEILYANGDGGMKHPPKWVRIVGTVTEAAIMVLIVINVAYVIVDQQSFNDSHSTAGDEPPESKYFPLELASTVVFTTECALVPLPAAKACVACMRACWVHAGCPPGLGNRAISRGITRGPMCCHHPQVPPAAVVLGRESQVGGATGAASVGARADGSHRSGLPDRVLRRHCRVPPPRHNDHDRSSGLTEMYLRFAMIPMPILMKYAEQVLLDGQPRQHHEQDPTQRHDRLEDGMCTLRGLLNAPPLLTTASSSPWLATLSERGTIRPGSWLQVRLLRLVALLKVERQVSENFRRLRGPF
jgi:hypothetical protein|eukprot:COSAG01_NODE_1039_length_11962_cov_32.853494_2_plen_331_part_00